MNWDSNQIIQGFKSVWTSAISITASWDGLDSSMKSELEALDWTLELLLIETRPLLSSLFISFAESFSPSLSVEDLKYKWVCKKLWSSFKGLKWLNSSLVELK